jgi:hypothetical protein
MGDAGRRRAEALFDVRRMAADYARACLHLDMISGTNRGSPGVQFVAGAGSGGAP